VVRAIGLALFALACTIPPTEGEVEDELRRIAKEVRPLPGELRVIALYASSRMDAWGQRMEAVAEGEEFSSQQARRLTRAFNQSERRQISVVTGGPYAELNERVVNEALEGVKPARLPGLTLVFVSPEPPSTDVRQAVSRRGSTLVYRASIRR
jgi:predicted secreted protein